MKAKRIFVGTLLIIIALNAFGGGYYGMSGAESVPVEWLQGSPFSSYFLPSLFLFVVVGGGCLLSGILILLNSKHGRKLSLASAGLLFLWIAVQVSIIGYVSWMQPAILLAAIVIAVI